MAKRFQFRLETVRRLREQSRDVQRRVVGEAVRAVAGVENRIAVLNDQLRQIVESTREERRTDHLDVPALRGQQFYRTHLHRRILESRIELDREKAALDVERAKLAAASAKLKAIEKLRERRWRRYQTELGREEQRITDDLNAGAFVRKGEGEVSA